MLNNLPTLTTKQATFPAFDMEHLYMHSTCVQKIKKIPVEIGRSLSNHIIRLVTKMVTELVLDPTYIMSKLKEDIHGRKKKHEKIQWFIDWIWYSVEPNWLTRMLPWKPEKLIFRKLINDPFHIASHSFHILFFPLFHSRIMS